MNADAAAPIAAAPPRKGSVRNAFLTTALGLCAGALAIEAAARWLLDDGMHFDLEMWKYARDLKQVSANPDIGHEHRPGASGVYMGVPVSVNSIGLRDREIAEAPAAGVTRIMMLGDSVTFGWGVRIEDTPAKLLETALNSQGRGAGRYEVINTGVGNYNTVMETEYFLNGGYRLKPDVVVLNYFINDAEPVPKRKRSFMTEYSYAAVMLASAFDKIGRVYLGEPDWKTYYSDLYKPDAQGWIAAQSAIGRLAEYCRENNIRLLVANYPELHELKPYPFSQVTAAVQRTASRHDVQFVDLHPAVAELEPTSLWVSPTDAHPNRIANIRYAEAIRRALSYEKP